MAAAAAEVIEVPRSFILLDELDIGLGKGGKQIDDVNHAGFVSYGLWQDDDITLTRWRAMLIGPQNTNLGQNIYIVEIVCDDSYPSTACKVRFQTKINMPCVDQSSGRVDPSKLDILRNWNKATRIQHVCVALREAMVPSARLPQPPAGSEYFS